MQYYFTSLLIPADPLLQILDGSSSSLLEKLCRERKAVKILTFTAFSRRLEQLEYTTRVAYLMIRSIIIFCIRCRKLAELTTSHEELAGMFGLLVWKKLCVEEGEQ